MLHISILQLNNYCTLKYFVLIRPSHNWINSGGKGGSFNILLHYSMKSWCHGGSSYFDFSSKLVYCCLLCCTSGIYLKLSRWKNKAQYRIMKYYMFHHISTILYTVFMISLNKVNYVTCLIISILLVQLK